MTDKVLIVLMAAGFVILAASMTTWGRPPLETAACTSSTPGGVVELFNCQRSQPAAPETPAPVAVALISQR